MILHRRRFLWVCAPALCRAAETRIVANAAELARAAADSRPGDVIVLRDGEWRDAALAVHGEDLTVRAETPGKVVLSGRSTLSISGATGRPHCASSSRGNSVVTTRACGSSAMRSRGLSARKGEAGCGAGSV